MIVVAVVVVVVVAVVASLELSSELTLELRTELVLDSSGWPSAISMTARAVTLRVCSLPSAVAGNFLCRDFRGDLQWA